MRVGNRVIVVAHLLDNDCVFDEFGVQARETSRRYHIYTK